VLTTTAAGLFGLVSGQKIAAKRRATIELASARRPVDAYMAATVADPGVASENATTDNGASEVEAATTTPPLQIVSATLRNTAVPTTPTKLSSDKGAEQPDQATANEPKLTTTASAKNEPSTATPWSVQISATQDQSAAQSLLAKLRNKGFDAYIVEAEINAAHWYRVRVGRFATNQEAEKIRRDLMASEKLASAFVTGR
jgi:cell division protein FtsN